MTHKQRNWCQILKKLQLPMFCNLHFMYIPRQLLSDITKANCYFQLKKKPLTASKTTTVIKGLPLI